MAGERFGIEVLELKDVGDSAGTYSASADRYGFIIAKEYGETKEASLAALCEALREIAADGRAADELLALAQKELKEQEYATTSDTG